MPGLRDGIMMMVIIRSWRVRGYRRSECDEYESCEKPNFRVRSFDYSFYARHGWIVCIFTMGTDRAK